MVLHYSNSWFIGKGISVVRVLFFFSDKTQKMAKSFGKIHDRTVHLLCSFSLGLYKSNTVGTGPPLVTPPLVKYNLVSHHSRS